jgi:hypothetical protein
MIYLLRMIFAVVFTDGDAVCCPVCGMTVRHKRPGVLSQQDRGCPSSFFPEAGRAWAGAKYACFLMLSP